MPDVNTTAILITAPGVTLDLNGFGVLGRSLALETALRAIRTRPARPPAPATVSVERRLETSDQATVGR